MYLPPFIMPYLQVSKCRVFTRGEGKLVVDEVSLRLLAGSQVDYSTELIGSTFRVIQNPRADSGCGCGVSFNLTDNNAGNDNSSSKR